MIDYRPKLSYQILNAILENDKSVKISAFNDYTGLNRLKYTKCKISSNREVKKIQFIKLHKYKYKESLNINTSTYNR